MDRRGTKLALAAAAAAVTVLAAALAIRQQTGGTGGPGALPRPFEVTLTRTACLGACPQYSLAVDANCRVSYTGTANVRVRGDRTARISRRRVEQLLAAVRRARYFALRGDYDAHEVTDLPWARTSVRLGRRYKEVAHYHGDRSAPRRLTELELAIDRIAGTDRWVRG